MCKNKIRQLTSMVIMAVFFVAISQELFAWGRTEHDAITRIAECNLKPAVKKRIESYLGGRSIVYYAAWMDDYRKTPEYLFTDTWHTGNVDGNFESTEAIHRADGDCIPALEETIKKLENYKALDDSTVAVHLKYLIHIIADMHCPVHVKYVNCPSFNVVYNGEKMSYHTVWDKAMLRDAHTWSYTEYQQQLDRCSAKEKKQIMQGAPREWFRQTAKDCVVIYEWAKPDDTLGKDFMNKAHFLAESQMLKAGYRMAYLLNKLFG